MHRQPVRGTSLAQVLEPPERSWRVKDHGPGIPREQGRRLFEPFSKSSQEAASSAPGVGLGLALSRRLAQAMRGDLTLEPTQNGACLVLALQPA